MGREALVGSATTAVAPLCGYQDFVAFQEGGRDGGGGFCGGNTGKHVTLE